MQYNTKLGLIMFAIYLLFYGGFVLINSFSPQSMEATPFAGLNWAIIYGVGLIFAAFIMAMIYGFLCIPEEESKEEVK